MTDQKKLEVLIRLVDWSNAQDGQIVVELLDNYAHDPMGGASPLSDYAKQHLAAAMAATPGAFSAIGFLDNKPVALANSRWRY